MKRALWTAAALLVVAAGSASAQGPGGGRRGPGGMMGGMMGGLGLLRNPAVQQELKMTQPQIDKLDAKQQELGQSVRELFQQAGDIRSMPQADRDKLMAKVQELQAKAVADILDTKQQARYRQIELQLQGPMAINRKDVADKLNLTQEQRQKVRDIQRQAMESMRALFQQGGGPSADREKLGAQIREMQKANNEKALAVMTPEQQKQWKTMCGEPFKLPEPAQNRQP